MDGAQGATTKNAGLFAFSTFVFGNNRCNPAVNQVVSGTALSNGFHGSSRSASTVTAIRFNQTSFNSGTGSQAPDSEPISVFTYSSSGSPVYTSSSRLAFYSIGESLDLALLDARVTDLINAFAVTIP
jgi:hypothetical protein